MTEFTGEWKRLDNGWLQAKVPLPFSLKWVNSYGLPDEDGEGWTFIDPGLRTDETIAFWERTMAEAGIPWTAVRRIVLTHHHPDHYGLAGWMQEKTGAPVYATRTAREAAERLWGEGETFSDELTAAFLAHGLAPELEADMREHLVSFRRKVAPHPADVRYFEFGETVRMGGADWVAIRGEGHAPGHASFLDAASGRLLCGDQVLPNITPNIGWMPGADPDPLGSFMASIAGMRSLDVSMAYPGHRDPFAGFHARLEEILEHHERRLAKMAGLAEAAGAISAFDMCEQLFGARLRANAHNLRFALAETIAHMIVLEKRGALRVSEDDGRIRYAFFR